MAKREGKTKEIKEKQNEIFEVVQYAKQELLEKQKADLPKFIKKRKKQFIQALERYNIINEDDDGTVQMASKTIPMLDLTEFCFAPFVKYTGGSVLAYSPEELELVFDYFKTCIREMNRYEIIPPNKEMFCSLCGISTQTFNEYKTKSAEMREVVLKIEDYIANYLNISGLTRKTDTVTGIFIQKSSLGRREETAPQQVVNNNNLVLSDQEFAELLSKYNPKK